ncbi:unnamed protein product (macronuclear) [Paramecium tetraurelia]|uniref:EGF-like domain-containing protein n=1 Tax=Paramecium tetraurelia TaxID=5888 RepID=A0BFC2_PARTE|nr:uncharacterized protein GSPATT00028274001 [Paramecium tetraurelia]CAK57239.1 unnamed protein product [Paramecium tetraurelia]|eukprot:XP_001424637.1 hypothetical protein (macronuclear) [Paramecium tetraurelia strain d4-2]
MTNKFFLLTILLKITDSQWLLQHSYASKDTLQFNMQIKNTNCQYTEYLTNQYQPANYINCTSSPKSYITLDQLNRTVSNCDYKTQTIYCDYMCLISFDLYYQGIWANEQLEFKFYNHSYTFAHTSLHEYKLNTGFCDSIQYEVKQINITHTQKSMLNFTFSAALSNGQVSLKNLFILNYQYNCYPKCSECSGPEYNQCQKCFYGTQQNNICPSCPFGQYYVKYKGCQFKKSFIQPLCFNDFCNEISFSIQYYTNLSYYPERILWSIIYDHQNQNVHPSVLWWNQFFYGIFKMALGISRYFDKIKSNVGYSLGFLIKVIFFNDLKPDSGIHFQFNKTYYASIYNTSEGIKLHNFTSIQCILQSAYHEYTSNQLCVIYGYFDIPQYPFLFSAIGNLTDPQSGWGMVGVEITADYCTDNCLACDISQKCTTCVSPYFLYRNGTCIKECNDLYQQNNGTYCKDFDDETPYSELIIRENINYTYQYDSSYKLIKQTGDNFLKGEDLYYSYWNGFLIFGGSFIWAQAQFERIHSIDRPHHSISIAFHILYGSEFPDNSEFIFTIDQNSPNIKKRINAKQNSDGTYFDLVSQSITHQSSTINITFECKGLNEPIKAFCGLYNFYLAVHYCKPYCKKCIDQKDCQEWNGTYNLTQIQFSQQDCSTNQYFDVHQSLCLNCTSSCLTCKSAIVCLSCKSRYQLTNFGCFCAKNQYEETDECKTCPPQCNQCLSDTFCIECIDRTKMSLINGQCNCINGYTLNAASNLCENNTLTLQCGLQCQNCISGKCFECSENWYVDPIEYICKQKCGDFVKLESEKCESSFVLPYRGCINCEPNCQSSCFNCGTGEKGCLECVKGYSLIDNLCYSICGDQILTEEEQCDDGNLIYGDGCHFCQYSCSDSCQNCIDGICFNYKLDHPLTKIQCDPVLGKEMFNNSSLCYLIDNLYLLSEIYNSNFGCDLNCQNCFFQICYRCDHDYILSVDSRKCIQKTSLFDYNQEHSLIKIGNVCLKCADYAYFDVLEQICKPNLSNIKKCQIQMLLSPDQFCNQCFKNCLKCSYHSCILCMEGYHTDYQSNCISDCEDGIQTINEKCEINEQTCLSCEFQISKYCQYQPLELCLQCKHGYYYNLLIQDCESICGDGIIAEDEDCEIQHQYMRNGCQQCKYTFDNGCKEYKDGLCNLCIEGYILINSSCYIYGFDISNNLQYYDFVRESNYELEQYCASRNSNYLAFAFNQCLPICGDGIITHDEECEDEYSQQSYGCFNCRYSCPINCLQCEFGQCNKCIDGFQILENICYPKCRDQLIKYEKQCDDGNMIPFDGCYKCQNSCQIECLICLQAKCVQCISGWNLIDGKCYQKCGDGKLAIISEEQCDNPLDLNCKNCKLNQCMPYCDFCDNLQQCQACQVSFQLVNNSCITICGDGIITLGYEQCDDGNEIEFDGCHNCEFSCSIGCMICQENNVCLKCNEEESFTLDHKTKKCVFFQIQENEVPNNNSEVTNEEEEDIKIIQNEEFAHEEDDQIPQGDDDQLSVQNCGNGKLQYSLEEECDDGNTLGSDGCSQFCTIESSFKCKNFENEKSECSFIQAPEFYLNFISTTLNSIQIVDLTFSQEIRLQQQSMIEDLADFSIEPSSKCQITVIPLINFTTELNMSHYQFSIQFYQSINRPLFKLKFKQNSLVNLDNIPLVSLEKSIFIGNSFVLSEQTKKKLSQIILLNDIVMYTLISISVLALLIGNPIMFLNLLNLLQSFSYLRYVQYQFPPHFSQFLETYSKISLQIFLDYLQIDQILTQLNGGQLPSSNKSASQTNQTEQQNQVFLINAKSCYISFFTSYLTYIIYKIITSKQIDNYLKKVLELKFENIKYLQIIRLFQKKIQQHCVKLKHQFFSKDIFQVYLTILHQLLFSAFMQFPNYSFQSFFEAFNSLNSLLALGLIMVVNFKSLDITSQKIKNKRKWKYFFEESKSEFWAANFKSFSIYRINAYIFVVVFLINWPEVQSIFLSIQSLVYLIYLCTVKPLISNNEYIKLIFREFLFLSTVGSFLTYSFNQDEEQLLTWGWIHISMLTTILGTSLFVDMIEFIGKLHSNYLKQKIKKEILQEKNTLSSPLQLIDRQNMQNLNKALSDVEFNLDQINQQI